MTTTPLKAKTRPQWATVLAVGFFIAGFGVVLYALGVPMGIEGLAAGGFVLLGVGAAASLFGGAVYFLDR